MYTDNHKRREFGQGLRSDRVRVTGPGRGFTMTYLHRRKVWARSFPA